MAPRSPLHPAGAVSGTEFFHFGDGDPVEIPLYRVFERRGSHSERNRFLFGLAAEQSIDQAAAETVAASHPVHNAQVMCSGEVTGVSVVEHACPVVVSCFATD